MAVNTRQHFVWQERLAAAKHLSPTLRLVGLRLALFRNGKTGRCFVGYVKLADAVLAEFPIMPLPLRPLYPLSEHRALMRTSP